MITFLRTPLLAAALVMLSFAASASTQKPQPRLTAPIDNSARATLPGSQPPRVRLARDLGAVDGGMQLHAMTLVFNRTAAQQAAIDALIAAQQDPASPQYHQWLTPEQFGARFGMADADIAKAEAWLQSQGFTIDSVSPSRDRISFSGSASAVASAFGAPLHHYAVDGETHFAPSADLSLPAALSGAVAAVTNLSDFRPRPRVHYASVVRPNFTSSQSGNHFLTPLDIATIYDLKPAYNAGYNGSGQSIAVVGETNIVTSDITNFQTALGQSAKAPTLILVPGTGTSVISKGDESESDLDLEYATGIAPGASIYFVYTGNNQNYNVWDALTYAVQNKTAPVISISYGLCEPALGSSGYTSLNNVLAQAATQGQTVVSATGDSGSTDCYGLSGTSLTTQQQLSVDFPASSQYVTGVGGTEFLASAVDSTNNVYFQSASGSDVVSSALAYIPEQVWNDDSVSSGQVNLSSGGGGVSTFTPRPSWQANVPGIPSGAFRLVPDIALDSSPNNASYAYCSSDSTAWVTGQSGSCNSGLRDSASQDLTIAGGTSFAAPIFAGMVAILNQARGYATGQGVIAQQLYSLAANSTTYASAFHDITTGSNACTIGSSYCSTAGAGSFAATIGYDEATGLGSLDFYNLLTAWPDSGSTTQTAPSFTLTASSTSVTSGNSTSSTVTVTPANGYTGTVSWSIAPSTLTNACYSIANTTVGGTTPVTATLSISTGSSTCASGFSPLLVAGTGGSASLHPPASPPRHIAPIAFAALGLASLLFFGGASRRRLPMLLVLLLAAGISLGLSGCGGSSSTNGGGGGGTQPTPQTTTYTLTLIGTDTAHSTITAKTTFTIAITSQT